MGAFKDSYYKEKELKEAYIEYLIEDGWVLKDSELDYDNIEEEDEDVECENCAYTDIDVLDDLNEGIFKKLVVRLGKKVKKWKHTDPNMEVVPGSAKDGKKPKFQIKKIATKIKRKKGQLKGKIKRKVKSAQMKLKRKLSQRKRSMFGIK